MEISHIVEIEKVEQLGDLVIAWGTVDGQPTRGIGTARTLESTPAEQKDLYIKSLMLRRIGIPVPHHHFETLADYKSKNDKQAEQITNLEAQLVQAEQWLTAARHDTGEAHNSLYAEMARHSETQQALDSVNEQASTTLSNVAMLVDRIGDQVALLRKADTQIEEQAATIASLHGRLSTAEPLAGRSLWQHFLSCFRRA